VHETSSEKIVIVRCQGGNVAKGHHFADLKSEEVKELFMRIHESQTHDLITVVDQREKRGPLIREGHMNDHVSSLHQQGHMALLEKNKCQAELAYQVCENHELE
jgi:hypothetical protein